LRLRASRRRPPRAGRLLAGGLVAACLVTAVFVGAREAARALKAAGTSSSHGLTPGQLSNLLQGGSSPPAGGSASPTAVPSSALLQVPYTVQAPYANWSFHQESCEEAAILMYHDFLAGDRRADIPPAEADQQLGALKAWQVSHWGAERDLDLQHTGQLARDNYGYSFRVLPATIDSIKAAIAAGHPVVVPVMTHALQNSYYGPKSVYHEVLVKGYTADGAITNDPGISQGKNWFYSWSVIFQAIDAQTPAMKQGRVMLVLGMKM
jgi:hypothetical protein